MFLAAAARVHLCSLLQRAHAADDSVLGCGLAEFVCDGPESCIDTRQHSRYQAQRTSLSDGVDAIQITLAQRTRDVNFATFGLAVTTGFYCRLQERRGVVPALVAEAVWTEAVWTSEPS